MIQLLVMPAAFYLAAVQWGINGVAVAWLVVHPIITIPPFLLYTLRKVELRGRALLGSLWPAISSGVAMAASVAAAQTLLAEAPTLLRLASAVAVGAVAYGGTLLLFYRRRLRHVVRQLRGLRK